MDFYLLFHISNVTKNYHITRYLLDSPDGVIINNKKLNDDIQKAKLKMISNTRSVHFNFYSISDDEILRLNGNYKTSIKIKDVKITEFSFENGKLKSITFDGKTNYFKYEMDEINLIEFTHSKEKKIFLSFSGFEGRPTNNNLIQKYLINTKYGILIDSKRMSSDHLIFIDEKRKSNQPHAILYCGGFCEYTFYKLEHGKISQMNEIEDVSFKIGQYDVKRILFTENNLISSVIFEFNGKTYQNHFDYQLKLKKP